MSASALISRLVQANAPAELIADIAMALARGEEAMKKDAEKRAKDRARKSVPRNSEDSTESAEFHEPPFLDKEIPPRPPKEIKPIPRVGDALPRKAGGFSAPDGVDPGSWSAFCQQRKKAITPIAFDRIAKTLAEGSDAGWPPGELIDRAVERGYETVFIPSEKRNGHRPANDRPAQPINPMVRAGLAAEARFASG